MDDPLGDDVTFHDPAEDIHQDRLHVLIRNEDLKRLCYLRFTRSASYIQEVSWFSSCVLDDIHRSHRQPGAVHETGDVTVQADVTKTKFICVNFPRFLFPYVSLLTNRVLALQPLVTR